MAVTSMWPIKGRVDQVINYARNPEKTTEKSHDALAALHAIDGVVEYAADDMKTEQRMYVTCLNCTEENAAQQFMETKRIWSQIIGKDKTGGRVCYHGYQSFAPGEVNAETAHEIGVKLAQRLWGNEYEVVIATHCNTNQYHNHYVLNPVSLLDGHKFFNSHADYQAMREESDRLCREYRLSVIEEPAGRGLNYGEYIAEQQGKPTNRSQIRADIDRAIKASVTEREFFGVLEQMGYEIKLNTKSGKPLSAPGLKPPGAKGFFRFHKLGGTGYSLEEIRDRIASNYRRRDPFPQEEIDAAKAYRSRMQPRPKATGLHALYIRYCFELKIITKYPASVKRVPFFMREDLRKLTSLDEQTRFLGINKIDTIEDLNHFRSEAKQKLELLGERRKSYRNELKRVTRAADSEGADRVRHSISEISAEMEQIRKSIRLCDKIEIRSVPMAEAFEELSSGQSNEQRKEEQHHELQHIGRGGTGRPDEYGRR